MILNKRVEIPEEIETDKKGLELIKYLNKCRKNIPEKYNHGMLLDYLADKNTDLLFSITTRGDGKTFNYLYLLAKLNEKFGIQTVILVRHMEVRGAMVAQIRDMYDTFDDFTYHMTYNLTPDYVQIGYGKKTPFYIVDLNNANDLKNYSAVLRNCSLTLYDEFLAVGGEYTSNEFAKFKTIFETMDRASVPGMEYLNNKRKAIFLGNPVDFGSEFLAFWNMYHMLEVQPMNTIRRHKNIAIERRKNELPQEHKNSRIFEGIGENESITGKFKLNSYNIKEPDELVDHVTVKTTDRFINIYREDKPVLEVSAYENDYDYNTDLVDNTESSIYLKPSYYGDSAKRRHARGQYEYANQYSKDYILANYDTLKIDRLLRAKNVKADIDGSKTYNKAHISALKARLIRDYLL